MSDPSVHNPIARRGLMFVVSSPSGAGKTTLCNRLLRGDDFVSLSVSATTRPRRPGEVQGVDYFFVDELEFDRMRREKEFLENAQVFENFYGTPRVPVERTLAQGHDVLFDIDWQGAQQLDEVAPRDVVKVFILPPSRDELEKRLQRRGQDPAEVVAKRMAQADSEMSHYNEYDYIIINRDLEIAEKSLRSILAAERLKRQRQTGLSDFVTSVIEGS
ncbi:MAG: guanylate kinase [Parvularculaceae bacterium]